MPASRALLGGLLLLFGAAACTSSTGAAASSSPAAKHDPAPVGSVPTTTAAPPPGLGAVHKTSVLSLSGSFTGPGTGGVASTTSLAAPGGTAKVTVTWHDEKAMSLDDLLPGCRAAVLSAEPGDGTVLSGVAAQVSAAYPAGVSAPLAFSYGDSRAVSADRAFGCAGNQADPAATTFTLTPQAASTTVMWVRFGSGSISGDDPSGYTITETDKGCGSTCATSYG
jgi:hypothetical protein